MTTRELRVAHLDCEHDAARLRRAIENVPGVNVVKILPHAGRLSVEIDEERTSLDTLSAHLRQSGFPISESPKQGPPPPWQNPKVLTSVASGVLLLIGWGLSYSGIPQVVIAAVFAGSAISGAYYFGREALEELIHERTIGIELLMSIAATIAFALGQWGEAAMLCFLYSISEALEGYTEAKTRGAIQALMKLTPKLATLLKEGRELGSV